MDQAAHHLGYNFESFWWIAWSSPLDAVRGSLITSASVLLGLFGVLLSLALIPLTIATSSYGNIILSNFLRDKGIQNVIGYFPSYFLRYSASIALPLSIPSKIKWFDIYLFPGLLIGADRYHLLLQPHRSHLQVTYVSGTLADDLMTEQESSLSQSGGVQRRGNGNI
jgi:hypothetical protein